MCVRAQAHAHRSSMTPAGWKVMLVGVPAAAHFSCCSWEISDNSLWMCVSLHISLLQSFTLLFSVHESTEFWPLSRVFFCPSFLGPCHLFIHHLCIHGYEYGLCLCLPLIFPVLSVALCFLFSLCSRKEGLKGLLLEQGIKGPLMFHSLILNISVFSSPAPVTHPLQ